jgi:hypothetical protein
MVSTPGSTGLCFKPWLGDEGGHDRPADGAGCAFPCRSGSPFRRRTRQIPGHVDMGRVAPRGECQTEEAPVVVEQLNSEPAKYGFQIGGCELKFAGGHQAPARRGEAAKSLEARATVRLRSSHCRRPQSDRDILQLCSLSYRRVSCRDAISFVGCGEFVRVEENEICAAYDISSERHYLPRRQLPLRTCRRLANNESSWRLFISDSTLRPLGRRQRVALRGSADDSPHSLS